MLKWLRKYNTVILVIGGVLLMVAWLLPQTIQELGRTRWGKSPMRLASGKVPVSEYELAVREYEALKLLFGADMLARGIHGGVNAEHWVMLTHEAREGGYLSGRHDGPAFLEQVAKGVAQQYAFQMDQAQVDQQIKMMVNNWTTNAIPRIQAMAHLTEDEVYRALGKLHGVSRMQAVYSSSIRYSDRRLINAAKEEADSAKIDYLLIGPESEMPSIPEPDEAAIQAHYEKFKTVAPGSGETGIGYLLPDRVKLAWLTIDQNAIESAIVPDAVEVRKRFLKQYPTGQLPQGQTEADVMTGIGAQVRTENLADLLRKVDQVVKTEFEKSTRKLESDGDYKKLPADGSYHPIDFKKLAETVAARLKDMAGAQMPAPTAEVREVFMGKEDIMRLPGIGQASLSRGSKQIPLGDLVFKAREIAGRNELVLQAGVPSLESASNSTGSRFYFMVLEARKESAPDSLDESRARVVKDIKRLAAFEKLKAQLDTIRQTAVTQGLEAAGKGRAPLGADIAVKADARVDSRGIYPGDAALNKDDAFRKQIIKVAESLDPLTDITKIDPAQRTVAGPVPAMQSVAVAVIKGVAPLTQERFRSIAGGMWQGLARRQLNYPQDDPFSLKRMEERLKVKYLNREREEAESQSAGSAKS